jgi:hypothetical protein
MQGRVFRRPVKGFSMIQTVGLKYAMISSVFCTSLSAPSRSRGVFAVVRAFEYWVQGGEAWWELFVAPVKNVELDVGSAFNVQACHEPAPLLEGFAHGACAAEEFEQVGHLL